MWGLVSQLSDYFKKTDPTLGVNDIPYEVWVEIIPYLSWSDKLNLKSCSVFLATVINTFDTELDLKKACLIINQLTPAEIPAFVAFFEALRPNLLNQTNNPWHAVYSILLEKDINNLSIGKIDQLILDLTKESSDPAVLQCINSLSITKWALNSQNKPHVNWYELQTALNAKHGVVNLSGVKLDNANLQGADLSYVIFYKARLTNCILAKTKLTHTDFTDAYIQHVNFAGAKIDMTIFHNTAIKNAKFLFPSDFYDVNTLTSALNRQSHIHQDNNQCAPIFLQLLVDEIKERLLPTPDIELTKQLLNLVIFKHDLFKDTELMKIENTTFFRFFTPLPANILTEYQEQLLKFKDEIDCAANISRHRP